MIWVGLSATRLLGLGVRKRDQGRGPLGGSFTSIRGSSMRRRMVKPTPKLRSKQKKMITIPAIMDREPSPSCCLGARYPPVGLIAGTSVGLTLGVGAVEVEETVAVAVGVIVDLGVAVGVGLSVAVGVGPGVTVGEGLGVGVGLGVEVGVGVGQRIRMPQSL